MTAMIGHFPEPGFDALPDRKQLRRVAAGIAISLAVHALLLSIYRQPRPAALPAPASEPLTVRLQAPQAPPVAEPAEPPVQPQDQTQPVPRARPPRRIIAVPPQPEAAKDKPFAVEAPPASPSSADPAPAPQFNLDAARSVARKVANEPDPAKVGTALERLPPPPLQTESKLERAIKGAKRPDCKDGVPGGLLAPIFLAMDKKDSGCKW
jgi:hypothetical protein